MSEAIEGGLSSLEFHVLLALASEPMYGYAIAAAVSEESDGTLTPRAGTLYRILARLMTRRLVEELDAPADAENHPGRPRRWYALTTEGRATLSAESERLKAIAALADRRLTPG